MDDLIDPPARFAADLAALAPQGTRLGLAVSGGPDSLALLLLAQAACPERIAVATVDHGLRPEAASEAAAVAQACARLGVDHAILTPRVSPMGNLQAEARSARYRALGEWARSEGLAGIITAHHADDQAETVLMRLNRGAGLGGLAAMRPRALVPGAADIALLRPLLGWRRTELSAIVERAGWSAADDPSNHDPRFERIRVRSLLDGVPWLDASRIAASAVHLRAAEEGLAWAITRELEEQVTFEDADRAVYCPRAPQAVRFGVVRLLVENLGHEGTPRGQEVARLLAALEAGGTATLAGLRADGRDPAAWRFAPAPPRR